MRRYRPGFQPSFVAPFRLPFRAPVSTPGARFRVVKVRVPVPVTLRVRTVMLQQPSVKISKFANRKIRLAPIREPFRFRTVRVVVPRVRQRVGASRWTAYGDRRVITVHSDRSTRRLLATEYNRVRIEERKSNRFKSRLGQVESIRSDRGGMLSAAVRSGASPQVIADTAMVSRAIYGDG